MRIAILTHGISPFGHQYAKAFSDRGHPSQVWSMTPSEDVPGSRMRFVGPPGFKPWESSARLMPYLKTLAGVRRAVRADPPDILFALYMTSAGLIACLSGHPHVVVSGQGSDINSHVGSRPWRMILGWQGRRACLVHAVSDALAETMRSCIGVDPAKIIVAPIGVDTNLLAYVEPSRRPGTGQIICTRAHREAYDHATLVRAMRRLKDRGVRCRLLFTNRMEVESTKALVREHGVEGIVAFRDGYQYEELPGLLAAADVYVSSSKTDGTSQSLLEALSTGTFPVASDIVANRPWVEHGKNGYLFPVGDDVALAERLAESLARPDVRAAAAPLNRRIAVEKGNINRLVDRLLAAFERCLNT